LALRLAVEYRCARTLKSSTDLQCRYQNRPKAGQLSAGQVCFLPRALQGIQKVAPCGVVNGATRKFSPALLISTGDNSNPLKIPSRDSTRMGWRGGRGSAALRSRKPFPCTIHAGQTGGVPANVWRRSHDCYCEELRSRANFSTCGEAGLPLDTTTRVLS